jgi:hypothetical protein
LPEIETIVRGRTYSFDAIHYDVYVDEGDPANEPVNHAGWTVKSQVRTKLPDPKTGVQKVIADLGASFPINADGSIAVRLTREFTAALKASRKGELWWDIVATDPDGNDHIIIYPEPIDIVDWPTTP